MTYSCEGRYYIEEKDRRGVTIYLTKTGKETGSLTQEQLEGSRVEPTLVSDQEISKACNLGENILQVKKEGPTTYVKHHCSV